MLGQRRLRLTVANQTDEPQAVVLQPWSDEHLVEPGEQVEVRYGSSDQLGLIVGDGRVELYAEGDGQLTAPGEQEFYEGGEPRPVGRLLSGRPGLPEEFRQEPATTVEFAVSPDQALVLFEWLSRTLDAGTLPTEDPAEGRVLDDLLATLEPLLLQPLLPEYAELLEAARARVRDAVEGT